MDVVLPALPPHWIQAFPGLTFRLVYPDAQGNPCILEVDGWSQTVSVSCAKARNTPLLAFPLSAHDAAPDPARGGYLRPAGGLYPFSMESRDGRDTVVLSWEDGALATLVARLQSDGRDVALLNTERLATCFRAFEDPWVLDLDHVAEQIERGEISAEDIRALPPCPARIPAGNGSWFLESALSPAVQSISGEVRLPAVPRGMHALFSTQGGMVLFQASPEGVALVRF